MGKRRVVIVGGVAGGATCAARLRRLNEWADITIFERGPYVSFANCGLPYYVGDVINDESKLLLASPALFRERFGIDVQTRCEVVAIDRDAQTVCVRNLENGSEAQEHYDDLVLSPGASPIRPPWPGIDLPGIFTLRTVPDSRQIRNWIETKKPQRAVVVGGGFIGLEMAENLSHRGIAVTVIELAQQVMPPLDIEMAEYASKSLNPTASTSCWVMVFQDLSRWAKAGSLFARKAGWLSTLNWSYLPSAYGPNLNLPGMRG